MRCMVGGVGGMRESFSNGDYLDYGKFCKNRILTGFFGSVPQIVTIIYFIE